MEFSEEDKRIISQMIECYKGVKMVFEEIMEPLKWLIVMATFGLLVWVAIQIGKILTFLPIPSIIISLISLLIILVGIYWVIQQLRE